MKKHYTLIKQKHPEAQDITLDVTLQGPLQRVHSIEYERIDEALITKAARMTKRGSGPSGMDADGWRRILISSSLGSSSSELRKALAEFIKKLCKENIEVNSNKTTSLKMFSACRMIPLNKNPGLRPIGLCEVLRQITGQVVMQISKDNDTNAAGSLQVCAGQNAGAEVEIHVMHDNYNDAETEAVLLIDAENSFNAINSNISVLCPIISTFINNCYCIPARLLILGGKEIKSYEGTTQGDPTSMAVYALSVTPLLNSMLDFVNQKHHTTKEVTFADDFTIAGKLSETRELWDYLQTIGPKYGYHAKAIKSHLIVKSQYMQLAKEIFADSHVQITSTGKRHLGAVIDDKSYKIEYVQ